MKRKVVFGSAEEIIVFNKILYLSYIHIYALTLYFSPIYQLNMCFGCSKLTKKILMIFHPKRILQRGPIAVETINCV